MGDRVALEDRQQSPQRVPWWLQASIGVIGAAGVAVACQARKEAQDVNDRRAELETRTAVLEAAQPEFARRLERIEAKVDHILEIVR